MDLRTLPPDMTSDERVSERRACIEKRLGIDLAHLTIGDEQIGVADEQNCEQMFGAVPIPVGLAGPLRIQFSSGEGRDIFLPLATTEGALVASVNRGCKAVTAAGGAWVSSAYVGITRSIAFEADDERGVSDKITALESTWKKIAEATSSHLAILSYEIDAKDGIVFLTIASDTDEAMGMNMVTIAAQAVGEFLAKELQIQFLTVAGNVDSDKKPSARTKKYGRGYKVKAEVTLSEEIIRSILKSDPDSLLKTAHAKLEIGSSVAGALGRNLHVANVVAALYLATGQDVAHVVEGSLTDTRVSRDGGGIRFSVDIPAILVGVRGGGTNLPAQKQCLDMVLKEKTILRPSTQLAETIACAALAGEISLLAAQSTHTLAASHLALTRKKG